MKISLSIFLLTTLLFVGGCGSSDAPNATVEVPTTPTSLDTANPVPPVAQDISTMHLSSATDKSAATGQDAGTEAPQDAAEADSAENLVDDVTSSITAMFAAPKPIKTEKPKPRETKTSKQPDPTPVVQAPPAEDKGPDIRLMGFLNAGIPKVVLRIDDEFNALTEGATLDGVTVVSIAPPDVVYEYNHKDRTISLYDQPWLASNGNRSRRDWSALNRKRESTSRSTSSSRNQSSGENPLQVGPASQGGIPPGLPGLGGGGPEIPGLGGALPGFGTGSSGSSGNGESNRSDSNGDPGGFGGPGGGLGGPGGPGSGLGGPGGLGGGLGGPGGLGGL